MTLSKRTEKASEKPAQSLSRESRVPIEVTHNVFVGTRHTPGVCTELNQWGIRAEISQRLSVGEIVGLSVPSDGFEGFARVTYRNQDKYGLYFVDLDEGQRDTLTCMLSHHHPDIPAHSASPQ